MRGPSQDPCHRSADGATAAALSSDGVGRLARLRARRLDEDERLVCMERARILQAGMQRHAPLSRTTRQAAVVRDLCEQITPVIEPEDLLLGRMPEVLPAPEEEEFVARDARLFGQPGVPGWLDSLSIYVPDWGWLLSNGLGGIAAEARGNLETAQSRSADREVGREFLLAATEGLRAVSKLIRRYAEAASAQAAEACPTRQAELEEAAARCERVAEGAPATFLEALQLLQIVHMVLSCLVGGRDITPGRLDQYLLPFYQDDLAHGRVDRDRAVILLAMFLLRLSQMAGNDTDFDDNTRRSPCQYTHLYVTVGGADREGRSGINPLSYAVLDAIDLLRYKEPTAVVRWRAGMDAAFGERVAELIRDGRPVTLYNDEVVLRGLINQGVPADLAYDYAHSACHNVVVAGHEAGTGPGGFHNLPRLVLLAMNAGRDPSSDARADAPTPPASEITTFDHLKSALRHQVRHTLAAARRGWEQQWRETLAPSCPLLQSCLMRDSIAQRKPCWQAARVSHFNHYLVGLATVVDSLAAIRQAVFEEGRLSLEQFTEVLAADWAGHEALRHEIRTRFPRYGQTGAQTRELAAEVGRMWVDEVESAGHGMERVAMWPGFYSHMAHVREGALTGATPDGRMAGDPLSENLSPSGGTPSCAPTSVLDTMAALPFDHTPSGATTLTLPPGDFAGGTALAKLLALIGSYFDLEGLQIQINLLDASVLRDAMRSPADHADLMVRVAGFSALFVRLSREVQEDVLRRCAPAGEDATVFPEQTRGG